MSFNKPQTKKALWKAILFAFLLALCCSGCSANERQGREKFEKKDITLESRGGPITVKAELAVTNAQRQQGLMYRKELKDGEGMLFIFEKDEILSFWMKNTLINLSIAFISYDGKIIEIFDMESGSLEPVQSSRSVRYALEVPQGWFGRAGIAPGDKMQTIMIE